MIYIKDLHKEKPKNEWDFIIDRSSPVGNPFKMYSEKDRNIVCDKYENYFYNSLQNNENFVKYVNKMIDTYKKFHILNLFCWCGNKRCHGLTIKKYIIKQIRRKKW